MLKTMLKTWLKTKLFAFHAQKRTHASTQQDDYKIAIRIEGLNMFLNAASGSGQRERMLRFYGVV